jgi:hypothetical protein
MALAFPNLLLLYLPCIIAWRSLALLRILELIRNQNPARFKAPTQPNTNSAAVGSPQVSHGSSSKGRKLRCRADLPFRHPCCCYSCMLPLNSGCGGKQAMSVVGAASSPAAVEAVGIAPG